MPAAPQQQVWPRPGFLVVVSFSVEVLWTLPFSCSTLSPKGDIAFDAAMPWFLFVWTVRAGGWLREALGLCLRDGPSGVVGWIRRRDTFPVWVAQGGACVPGSNLGQLVALSTGSPHSSTQGIRSLVDQQGAEERPKAQGFSSQECSWCDSPWWGPYGHSNGPL